MAHDPLWEILLEGDEVEWVARPGVNLDRNGNPRPWKAPHRASVLVRAPGKTEAVFLAQNSNPGLIVKSAKRRK